MHQNKKIEKILPKNKETINTHPNHDNNNNTYNDDNDKIDHNNDFDDKK
jgi:hypothetical protein